MRQPVDPALQLPFLLCFLIVLLVVYYGQDIFVGQQKAVDLFNITEVDQLLVLYSGIHADTDSVLLGFLGIVIAENVVQLLNSPVSVA